MRASIRPIVFGEVLFDRFKDGRTVCGGAPFNVAWHLRGFGLDPLFVSRVGRDAPGAFVMQRMAEWGMDVAGIQHDGVLPTGVVDVTLEDGQPSYAIRTSQAFDFIDAAAAEEVARDLPNSIVYFGSLITRSDHSLVALHTLLAHRPAFVDVNLRPGCWTRTLLDDALAKARWAKLNNNELTEVTGSPVIAQEYVVASRSLLDALPHLELLIATFGAHGAGYVARDAALWRNATRVTAVADTVGAGDAFSAVTLIGLLHDWPLLVTLERSIDFAADVCRQHGGTALDPSLYVKHLTAWRSDKPVL